MRKVVLVAVAAVIGAVAATLMQKLISGDPNPAVTGGAVGAVVAVLIARGGRRSD